VTGIITLIYLDDIQMTSAVALPLVQHFRWMDSLCEKD